MNLNREILRPPEGDVVQNVSHENHGIRKALKDGGVGHQHSTETPLSSDSAGDQPAPRRAEPSLPSPTLLSTSFLPSELELNPNLQLI